MSWQILSSECGRCCQGSSLTRVNEMPKGATDKRVIAEAAAATLVKLNSLMKQTKNWQDEKLRLESKVRSLRIAMKAGGMNPEEALKPDPLIIHQRAEIKRLELANEKLESQLRNLRDSLAEAEGATTCAGVQMLRERLAKVRKESSREREMLRNEMLSLKLKVEEAEEDSSCSALNRLRKKLREFLNGDKKMDEIISGVAVTGCRTMIDLSNELTRLKETREKERLESSRQDAEIRRLKEVLEAASSDQFTDDRRYTKKTVDPEASGKEQETEIKDSEVVPWSVGESSPRLLERVKELEDDLEDTKERLRVEEYRGHAVRNELVGAKLAYNSKLKELDASFGINEDLKKQTETLKMDLQKRDDRIEDLVGRLANVATAASCDVEDARRELTGIESDLCRVEGERDQLLEDIVKIQSIVSERNDRIVEMLAEKEALGRARVAEYEGVRTELTIALAENEKLKGRVKSLEGELEEALIKFNEISQASGDSLPLRDEIKNLEEEMAKVESLLDGTNKDLNDANYKAKDLESEVFSLNGEKARLEKELSVVGVELAKVKEDLLAERAARGEFEKREAVQRGLAGKHDEMVSNVEETEKNVEKVGAISVGEKQPAEEANTATTRIKTAVNDGGAWKTMNTDNGRRSVRSDEIKAREIIVSAEASRETMKDEKSLVNAAEKKLESMKAENRALKLELNEMRGGDLRLAENLGDESKNLESRIGRTERELEKVRTERKALKIELMKVRRENYELRMKNRNLIEESNELKNSALQLGERLFVDLGNLASREDSAGKFQSLKNHLANWSKSEIETLKESKEETRRGVKSNDDALFTVSDKDQVTDSIESRNISVQTTLLCSSDTGNIKNVDHKLVDGGQSRHDEKRSLQDFIRANEQLKRIVRLQNSAVRRIRDFISYLNGTTTIKPVMPAIPVPSLLALSKFDFDNNLMETLNMAQQLSKKILYLEVQVRKLETTFSGQEDPSTVSDESVRNRSPTANIFHLARDRNNSLPSTDSEQPMSFTPVSEILRSSTNLKPISSNYNLEKDNRIAAINERILLLQSEIKMKQREAARKVFEMREAIRVERDQLMEATKERNIFH